MRFYKPLRMTLETTQYCPNRCAHCCSSCGPYGSSLSDDVITRLMEEARSCSIGSIAITGGEPFSDDNLYHAVREARNNGIDIGIITTSAFFGETRKEAARVLRRLKNAGFSKKPFKQRGESGLMDTFTPRLRISSDMFHKEFVPIDYVINTMKAYYDVFGDSDGLMIEHIAIPGKKGKAAADYFARGFGARTKKEGMMKIKEPIRRDETTYTYCLKRGEMRMLVAPMEYAGRAKAAGRELFEPEAVNKLLIKEDEMYPCFGRTSPTDSIIVEGDGSVHLCCSGMIEEIPCLKVGDIRKDGLKDIIDKVNGNSLFNLMMAYNPLQMIEQVDDVILGHDPEFMYREVVSVCEACKLVLSDDAIREDMTARADRDIDDIRKRQQMMRNNLLALRPRKR